MVARPQLGIVVDRMTLDDLPEVRAIERDSFTTPWPPHAYRTELETNRMAHYIVARYGDDVVGFGGMWLMVDEAHITTFAVHRDWRRQGIGERLLLALLDLARARGAHEATLEVRPSNLPARRLYEKYGFHPVGRRPRYYSDNNEDAVIMTTEPLEGRAMQTRIDRLRGDLAARSDAPGRRRVGSGQEDDEAEAGRELDGPGPSADPVAGPTAAPDATFDPNAADGDAATRVLRPRFRRRRGAP